MKTALDVADPITQESSACDSEAVRSVPNPDSHRLLATRKPEEKQTFSKFLIKQSLLQITHHIEVINMNDGSEHASAAPEKALNTASSVKFLAQACNMRKTPHMKILTPKYFPIGKRCIMKFVGTTFREHIISLHVKVGTGKMKGEHTSPS